MLLSDYKYDLLDEEIAKYPLDNRSHSKLLVFKNKLISDCKFDSIGNELPKNASLYFNNTKVIPARLAFTKDTGAAIEVFLLHPVSPTSIVQQAMEVQGESIWECMIGNAKKWKSGQILKKQLQIENENIVIEAVRIEDHAKQVKLSWPHKFQFSEIVEAIGKIPLPPYLNRESEEKDTITYQTVYSEKKGAVAAPTAGLHFTNEVLNELTAKNIQLNYLTLHVGAGTFMPVKHDNPIEHPMHNEQIVIEKSKIKSIIENDFIVPVGTTSMRSLESLYWFGVQLQDNNYESKVDFFIPKLYPYEHKSTLSKQEAFKNILAYMEQHGVEQLIGETEIFIFPSYEFKVCNALITNFHQPGSTLLMLIAAFIGGDWKKIYEHAKNKQYRFLSYGDSSLLFPN